MKTLTFVLTEENRKLTNVTLPLKWETVVKTIALTRFKAGTLIFDKRDLNDVDFILKGIKPKSALAIGQLMGVHANLESIIVTIEPFDNVRGELLTKVYNTLTNDDERSKLIGFGWSVLRNEKNINKDVEVNVGPGPYIRYDSIIGESIKEKLIDAANLDFRMFDTLAKHINENKPSIWKVLDETCIEYRDKHLKLSILSSKDALHVLMMLTDNQTERFHLDTWDDVFDYVKEPATEPHDSIIRNFLIDVLISQGVK